MHGRPVYKGTVETKFFRNALQTTAVLPPHFFQINLH